MNRRKRIIVFDDNRAHAEDVRDLLVSVTAPQWKRAGGHFDLTKEEIDIATSSAPYVASWLREKTCDYDLIVCDIHMGGTSGEGALPVLKALRTIADPPLLLVMTERTAWVNDPVRHQIEDMSDDPNSAVLCVVTAKHNEMANVRDPERQLEKREWRDIFVRAVVNRAHPAEIKRLQRESKYHTHLQPLPALKQAFSECAEAADKPLIVVVSERRGLLGSFAKACNNDVEFFRDLRPGTFADLPLEDLPKYNAVCVEDADRMLRHAFSQEGKNLEEQLQFLLHRRLLLHPDKVFEGQLILQVTPGGDAELSASSNVYQDFPKVRIPAFSELRSQMMIAGRRESDGRSTVHDVVKFMLAAKGVVTRELDVAVMAAYDWSLGFGGQSAGVEALRMCVEWLAGHAEDGRTTPGLVIERLTQSKEGRDSIYFSLDEAHLLLLILERLAQDFEGQVCLQVAAFLYFKTLCTAGHRVERDRIAAEFWGAGRLFEKLKAIHKFGLDRNANGWPAIEDAELYAWRDRESPGSKSIAARMQDRLAKNMASYTKRADAESRDHIGKLWSDGSAGRKDGENQLDVLDRPYRHRRNLI